MTHGFCWIPTSTQQAHLISGVCQNEVCNPDMTHAFSSSDTIIDNLAVTTFTTHRLQKISFAPLQSLSTGDEQVCYNCTIMVCGLCNNSITFKMQWV